MKNQRELQNMVNEMIWETSKKISCYENGINQLKRKEINLRCIYMYNMYEILELITELVSKIEEKEYVWETFKFSVCVAYYTKIIYLREKTLDSNLLGDYFTMYRDKKKLSENQIEKIVNSYIFISRYDARGNIFEHGEYILCFNNFSKNFYNNYDIFFQVEIENDKYSYILDFVNRYLLQYRLENEYYTNDGHWEEYKNLVDSYVEEYQNQRKLCKKM